MNIIYSYCWGMILEVRYLRIIEAIAKEGGVSSAAKRIHLTQPAVSHALRQLESSLGVRLFVRGPKGMLPTEEGNRLLRSAGIVLDELQQAERELAEHRAGRLGVLRLATHCYTTYHWLPRILKFFLRDFPDVDIQIVPEVTRQPIAALLAEKVDLAIVSCEPDQPGLVAEPLFEDEFVAVMPPHHRLASRPYLEAEDFKDEHLLLHFDAERSILFTQMLIPAGVTPRRVSELHLTEAVVEMVKAGLGISVVARWTVDNHLAAGTLKDVRLTANGLRRTWRAVTLLGRSESEAVKALIDLMRCCAFTV
jgi:LysR family transcriptional regulator for metE and metH